MIPTIPRLAHGTNDELPCFGNSCLAPRPAPPGVPRQHSEGRADSRHGRASGGNSPKETKGDIDESNRIFVDAM